MYVCVRARARAWRRERVYVGENSEPKEHERTQWILENREVFENGNDPQ
jgi:hypothetical protein